MNKKEIVSKVVRPKLHEKFRALLGTVVDDEENDENFTSDQGSSEVSSLSGLSLIIEYEDSKGRKSQRVISCRQYLEAGEDRYLKAFCHHRSAIRSFRLDRIVDVFDPLTGESLSPVQIFFAQFAPDIKQTSGLTWGLSVSRRADLIAVLNVLVFLARCDQEFHSVELEALEEAITRFWLRLEIRNDPDCEAILNFAQKLSPDGELFWVALHQIKNDPILVSVVRRSAKMLVEADGVVKDIEAYWTIELESFFSE